MSIDAPLTAEETDALLGETPLDEERDDATVEFQTATTIDTGASKVLCPVVLTTTHGKVFETNGLNTCTYTQVGMYLAVYKAGEAVESAKHYVIPWQQVAHCELKFDQMVELAEAEDESSSN